MPPGERVMLQRPRLVLAAALLLMITTAWLLLANGPPASPGAVGALGPHLVHDHAHMAGPATRNWRAADVLAALSMWWTMSVAMMLPTAAPAILSFADGGAGTGAPTVRTLRLTGAFAIGYLLVWWSFGIAATAVQWLLADALQHLPRQPGLASVMAGCLLLIVGLYQFSGLKEHCLAHCRGPLAHFRSHWRAAISSALRSGLDHGVHCLGCCWALMTLMLLTGAMNIGWTAILTLLMLAEKLLPGGRMLGRLAGVALIGWGGLQVVLA